MPGSPAALHWYRSQQRLGMTCPEARKFDLGSFEVASVLARRGSSTRLRVQWLPSHRLQIRSPRRHCRLVGLWALLSDSQQFPEALSPEVGSPGRSRASCKVFFVSSASTLRQHLSASTALAYTASIRVKHTPCFIRAFGVAVVRLLACDPVGTACLSPRSWQREISQLHPCRLPCAWPEETPVLSLPQVEARPRTSSAGASAVSL